MGRRPERARRNIRSPSPPIATASRPMFAVRQCGATRRPWKVAQSVCAESPMYW